MAYIRNTGHIKKKSKNIQNSILVPGVQKTGFLDFPGLLRKKIRKSWPETLESRVRRPGNLE